MTDQDAVLAANLEFYRAFATRDLRAMDALWAQRAPVVCLHPGWTALKDREAVMESWAGILSNPEAPRIACFDEEAFVYGDTALVLCEEELDGGTLASTVRRTGRPARIDNYDNVAGSVAARVRDVGVRAAVGVPVSSPWGGGGSRG